jgi:hypothetical protein
MRLGPWANRLRSFAAAAEPVFLWAFLSLLAIAWAGRRPYVALAMAVLGGVALGLSSVANYSSSSERALDRGAQEGPAPGVEE